MSTKKAAGGQKNPFPGLRPFREDEDYLFFGREKQVDAMVDKLAANHFLAVVGSSGSGKSSLVNCGLRPALRSGLMARAGTSWRMTQFRPGNQPIKALALALAENGGLFPDYQTSGMSLAEVIETNLRMSRLGLIDIFEQAQLEQSVNLLIVVDQFEELFRYQQLATGQQADISAASEEATAFINLLLTSVEHSAYPIYVVITMRSDFLGDCAQFNGLSEAINRGQYLVPRLTRNERRAAIRGPVGVCGAEISSVLLTRLINDVGDNPDQLSILQHALNRTWARWQHQGSGSGPLELTHYQSIGTMAKALDQHAEKAYAELTTDRQQQLCEKLFKALTDKATDPRGIRRPTRLGTLCALTDATEAEVTAVIELFRKPSRSFLMPPAGKPLETESIIDISHESLMRVWRRLNGWADEEARSAQTYRRLAETALLHEEGHAALWQDPDLQMALQWYQQNGPNAVWAERYHPEFERAVHFLNDSVAERDRLKKVEEEQRQRELQRSRKIACGAAVFSLLLVVVTLFALKAMTSAQQAKAQAVAEQQRADAERQQAEKAMTYMLFMSDQLKGLGKPYLMEYLGQNLEVSVTGKEDALSKLIRGRARFLEGQAALEQGETGDYGEALRALVKFELYRAIVQDGLNKERKEDTRWKNELAVAHQSIGATLHVLSSWPNECYTLASKYPESARQAKFNSCEKGLKKTFNHLKKNVDYEAALASYVPLLFAEDNGVKRKELLALRDQAYQQALDVFPWQKKGQESEKSAASVLNLAGIYISIGDHTHNSATGRKKAIESYGSALRLVEENIQLSERSMARELLKVSGKIDALLRNDATLPHPEGYRPEYAFVTDYLTASQGPDVDYVRRLYQNPVERFIRQGFAWNHEQIEQDKKNYFRGWPEVKFFLIGKIEQKTLSTNEKMLSFPIQYYTNSKERNETRSGRVMQFLKLKRPDGANDWKIVQDYQEGFERE